MEATFENQAKFILHQKITGIGSSAEEIIIGTESGMEIVYKINERDSDGFIKKEIRETIKG